MCVLNKLVHLANKLDKRGLYSEASMIDDVIKEAAQTLQQQVQELGKQMTNRLINTVVGKMGGGAVAAGQKAVIEGNRGQQRKRLYDSI